MTFIKALGPILARGPDPIIVRRDLEGRGPSASDHPRQISQQFDRCRVAWFGHAQDNIVDDVDGKESDKE